MKEGRLVLSILQGSERKITFTKECFIAVITVKNFSVVSCVSLYDLSIRHRSFRNSYFKILFDYSYIFFECLSSDLVLLTREYCETRRR